MPESEIQAVRRIYDALSQWNVDQLAKDVTHDFELILPGTVPWGGTRHGQDGVEAFATIFRDYVEGQWADPDDFVDGGDLIVVMGGCAAVRGSPAKNSKSTSRTSGPLRRECPQGVGATLTRHRSWLHSAHRPSAA